MEILNDAEIVRRFEQYLKLRKLTIESNKLIRARNLHMPKLPSGISESLSARGIVNGELLKQFYPFRSVERRQHPDIVADGHCYAVKGSVMMNGGWQSITNDDRSCEAILWLDFYPLVEEGLKILPVTIFYNPNGNIPAEVIKPTYDQMNSFYEVSDEYEHVSSITFPGFTSAEVGMSVDRWKIKTLWPQGMFDFETA